MTNLWQLHVLHVVNEPGSFTAAARPLPTTPPGVRQQVPPPATPLAAGKSGGAMTIRSVPGTGAMASVCSCACMVSICTIPHPSSLARLK